MIVQFFEDLTNPALTFLPRALLTAIMSALLCGVVGTHVVLRGMSFAGDAIAHAVFPGIAVAFALQGSILVGGLVAGVVVAVLVAITAQSRRVGEDSLIGVFMAGAFALGLLIMARVPGYTGSLESFLFGSLTGVTTEQMVTVAVAGLVIVAVVAVAHPLLVMSSVDRDFARSMGVRVGAVDVGLYVLVATTVVISVQMIGNVLVLALLITPAATARLLTSRVVTMMCVAPAFGMLAAIVGIWASWNWDLPAGAAIVTVATVVFLLVWLLAQLRSRLAAHHPRGATQASPIGNGKRTVAGRAIRR